MTDPLFGITTRIIGVNWGGIPVAILNVNVAPGPAITNTPTLFGFNSNIVLPDGGLVISTGSPSPIASQPPGATGFGTDLTLGRKFALWRSQTTQLGSGFTVGGFGFYAFSLNFFKSAPVTFKIAPTAGAIGTGWTYDVSCIVTKRLSKLAVDTATGVYTLTFGDTTETSDLRKASIDAKSPGWLRDGLVLSAAAVEKVEFAVCSVKLDAVNNTVSLV